MARNSVAEAADNRRERERSKNEDRWILKTEKQNERDRDEMGDPWGKP